MSTRCFLTMLTCLISCVQAAEVPTWTIVMLIVLSCLIVLLLCALIFTLHGIRRLSADLPAYVAKAPGSVAAATPAHYPAGPTSDTWPGVASADSPMHPHVELQPRASSVTPHPPAAVVDIEQPLDPEQQAAVAQMRAALPPGAHESYTIFGRHEVMDNEFFLRFLRARDFDPVKSRDLMLHYIEWRATNYPRGPDLDRLATRVWSGMVYCDFKDKAGNGVVVLRVRLHDRNLPAEETKDYAVLWLDTPLYHTQPQGRRFSVLVDLNKFGYANADLTALKNCLSLLDQCYPERLAGLWFIHANFLFMNLWKLVKGFINPVTAGKIHFFGGDFHEQLRQRVDPAVLPAEYGGEAPNPPEHFVGRFAPPGLRSQ